MKKEERYKYLINARNFHYENFNKWMTYFYVAIGSLFIGYYTIKTSDKNLYSEEILLLIIGYITSLFWYWSSKGYYYWNINFITLVNDCEENDLKLNEKERIYFVFANKKTQNSYLNPISGANISTSKIAILFSFVITLVWGNLLCEKVCNISLYFNLLISLTTTLLLSFVIPKVFLQSKIEHFFDLELKQPKNKKKK